MTDKDRTPEEIEKLIKSFYESLSKVPIFGTGEVWKAFSFTFSKDKRFVAYGLDLYEDVMIDTYSSSLIGVYDLQERKEERKKIGTYRAGICGLGEHSLKDKLDSILEVSDEEKIKYKTADGLEHIL